MQKESLVCLSEGQDCCPCITLHIPLFLYVQLGVYKLILKNSFWSLAPMLGFPMSYFSPFLSRIPIWSGEAHHVYLLALAAKIHLKGSLRRGTLRYSSGHRWPNIDGANLLSRGFIGFPRKPSYSASFSPPKFPTILFLPSLILYFLNTYVFLAYLSPL